MRRCVVVVVTPACLCHPCSDTLMFALTLSLLTCADALILSPSLCWSLTLSLGKRSSLCKRFQVIELITQSWVLIPSSKGPLVKHNPYLMCEHLMWCDVWAWASALQPHTITQSHTHTLTMLITFTCCYDQIKGTQEKNSLPHSLIHSLSVVFT